MNDTDRIAELEAARLKERKAFSEHVADLLMENARLRKALEPLVDRLHTVENRRLVKDVWPELDNAIAALARTPEAGT